MFEIGGPEVVSYGGMMREYGRLRGLRRLLLPVPVLTPHLSGLWLALVTPAQARVGRALVEGLRNSTVVRSTTARDTFAIRPMPLRDADPDDRVTRQRPPFPALTHASLKTAWLMTDRWSEVYTTWIRPSAA